MNARIRRLAWSALLAGLVVAVPDAVAGAGRSSAVSAAVAGGQISISGWATFSGGYVAARSDSDSDAATGGAASGGELIRAELTYRPELEDLFMRLEVTSIPSLGAGLVGDPTMLYGLRTVIAGVPVEIRAQSAGTSGLFGLFSCASETGCSKLADLAGGYGTSGVEVVAAIPLSVLAANKLPLKEGDRIGSPTAFTVRAPYLAGAVDPRQNVDAIALATTATVTIPARSLHVTVGSLTRAAELSAGKFTVKFPRSEAKSNPLKVITRTCLGPACVVEEFWVRLGS